MLTKRTAALFAVYLAVAGVAFVSGAASDTPPNTVVPVVSEPVELPPEWRWERQTISFDGMYMNRR